MKSFVEFNQILIEGDFKSENAYRVLWNKFVNQAEKEIHGELSNAVKLAKKDDEKGAKKVMSRAAELMRDSIDKAKNDPKHPLSFANSDSKDYTGGKTDDDEKSYWDQLDANVDAVAYAPSERKMRTAIEKGWTASGTGASSAELTKQVKKGTVGGSGLKSATQKSDVVLSDPNNEKSRIGISHKQGGATFLATGEPGEVRGVGSTAAKRVSKSEIQYRPSRKEKGESDEDYKERQSKEKSEVKRKQQQRRRELEDKTDRIATPLDYRGSDSREKTARKAQAQTAADDLRQKEPRYAREISQQHATGKDRFKGQTGTANVAVKVPGRQSKATSTRDKGDVIHSQGQKTYNIGTGQETITPGASAGRGTGRPMTARYRTPTAADSPGPATGTQGTFRDFQQRIADSRGKKKEGIRLQHQAQAARNAAVRNSNLAQANKINN